MFEYAQHRLALSHDMTTPSTAVWSVIAGSHPTRWLHGHFSQVSTIPQSQQSATKAVTHYEAGQLHTGAKPIPFELETVDCVLLGQNVHFLAGVNAARRAQDLATVVVPRDSSYLGTLVDDLVTKVAFLHCHKTPVFIVAGVLWCVVVCNGV